MKDISNWKREDHVAEPTMRFLGQDFDYKPLMHSIEKHSVDVQVNYQAYMVLKLICLRKARGMSRGVVADQLGVTENEISELEDNRSVLTVDRLYELCNIYKTSVTEMCEAASRTQSKIEKSTFSRPSLGDEITSTTLIEYLACAEMHLGEHENHFERDDPTIGSFSPVYYFREI